MERKRERYEERAYNIGTLKSIIKHSVTKEINGRVNLNYPLTIPTSSFNRTCKLSEKFGNRRQFAKEIFKERRNSSYYLMEKKYRKIFIKVIYCFYDKFKEEKVRINWLLYNGLLKLLYHDLGYPKQYELGQNSYAYKCILGYAILDIYKENALRFSEIGINRVSSYIKMGLSQYEAEKEVLDFQTRVRNNSEMFMSFLRDIKKFLIHKGAVKIFHGVSRKQPKISKKYNRELYLYSYYEKKHISPDLYFEINGFKYAIDFHGDFWHNNPTIERFKERYNLESDIKRFLAFNLNNVKYLIIWESEYLKRLHFRKIIPFINQTSTTIESIEWFLSPLE